MNGISHDAVGHAVSRPAMSGAAEARRLASAAAGAFAGWSACSPALRRDILLKAAELLEAQSDEFARRICEETGGTREWSALNVSLGAAILKETSSLPGEACGEVLPSNRAGTLSLAIRQPCGVVLSMAPWNAPIVLPVRAIATPLACGNTVVFKASELCPLTHQLVVDIFHAAGVPAAALAIVHNEEHDAEPVVEALIAHPSVRRVNFTGSTRVGRTIAALCARHLKRCLLELGGKAPLIVLDDADIDAAVEAAAHGAFFHQGQICMSTERIVVHETLADIFIERLRSRAEVITAGDSARAETRLGRMISEDAALRVKGLIDDAVAKGARLVVGGRRRGAELDATVLDRVSPDMRIYYEETFGPVASVIRYADIDEAVSIANDTEYGLTAAVFGRDIRRALDVARRLETGICHINGTTIHDEPQMPFGGVKASGYGRFGGKAGIEEFTELRWITVQHPGGDRWL